MIRALVGHSLTVIIAVLVVLGFGTLSYLTLPRESAPDISVPFIMVTTPYPGVSPEDVEGLITIPLESELASLRDVKEMGSSSMEGVSLVFLEFEPDTVIEDALQRVRDRVNTARTRMPDDAEDPAVRELDFEDFPILLINIQGGASVDEEDLKILGEALQDEILRIPGVLDADLAGGLEREIRVEADPARLAHWGLSLNDLTAAIQGENVNIPGGEVGAGASTFLVRVPGEFTAHRQVEDVAIKEKGGRAIYVRDVATVVDGYAERTSYARLNGQTTVTLSVKKRSGENIVEIAEAAKDIAAAQAATWPDGVSYRVVNDQSERISEMVNDLQNNIITALILVVGVILLFMGLRNSLFVAFSIPTSMLASMMVLDLLGFTLNMIVLFSLILALGMLVDNAIVVVENVYRHMEMGKDRRTASIDGTKEVAIAVLTSTTTTVAAFLPLAFWGGITGEFMGFLPKTLIVVLISSYVVAIGVLPVLMSRIMPRTVAEAVKTEDRPGPGPIMSVYRWVLRTSIRWRYVSAFLGAMSFIVTFGAYILLNHGTEFFPNTDPSRMTVFAELPQGAELDATDRVLRQVEPLLAAEPNVAFWVTEPGVAGGAGLMGVQTAANRGRISVEFLPDAASAAAGETTRVESTVDTLDRIREKVQEIPGATFTVEKERLGPPVGTAVEVLVSGEDFHEVGEYAQVVRREVAAIEGVTDLVDDYKVGRPELALRIDRGAAKRVGISSSSIGSAVRAALSGTVASTLREGDEEYDIVVTLADAHKADLQGVLDLRVPGEVDQGITPSVPLSTVASYELRGGAGTISHVDQDLVVTLSGDVAEGYNENAVRGEVEARIAELETPAGITLSLGGSNDAQNESIAFLGRAFLIALALILLVLVTQFDSLAAPLIIVATVTLSLIGVLWGLILTGTPFGFIMTGIGVISLAGVVVNNAIVLLDYVGKLRKRGYSVEEALVEAGMTRFRPVMLTAITTILGLVPMALGISIDFSRLRLTMGSSSAQWWGPMAIAVIFGLAIATVLTLVMVPTLYGISDDLGRLWRGAFKAIRRERPVAVAAKLLPLAILGLAWPGGAEAVTLEEAYRAAEEHNVQLALAREQAIQASTIKTRAWASLSPTVTASGSYNVNQYEQAFDMGEMFPPELLELMGLDPEEMGPTVFQEKEYFSGSVTVAQPLFYGSALPGLRAAKAMAGAAEHDERRQRQQVRALVAAVYYGLWAAREGEAVSEAALDNARSQELLADRQVDAGLAPARSRLQGQLAVARAERELAGAVQRRVEAEEAFFRVTGLSREVDLEIPDAPVVPPSLDDALDQARQRRPDLRAAESRSRAARLERTARYVDWLPRLDGSFTWLWTENTGLSPENNYWMLSVNASWRLWDGGFRLADQRDAASRARQSALLVVQTDQVAEEEVRGAWERYRRAQLALDSVERELELARENLRLAETGFSAGSTTWLEVEVAELGLQSTELAAITERVSRDLAAVELLVATGAW